MERPLLVKLPIKESVVKLLPSASSLRFSYTTWQVLLKVWRSLFIKRMRLTHDVGNPSINYALNTELRLTTSAYGSWNHSLCQVFVKTIWPTVHVIKSRITITPDQLQPLEISVNKSDKNFLQQHVHEWYTQQTCQQLKGMVPQDLKLTIMSHCQITKIFGKIVKLQNFVQNPYQ